MTTLIRLRGGGADGLGEDVSPHETEDYTLHVVGPVFELAGTWTLESFCDHLAEIDQWPVPATWDGMLRWRNWAFESAALDLALAQAGSSLHEAIGRTPSPVRFVNSLGLGDPPTYDADRAAAGAHPDLRFKLDVTWEWTGGADGGGGAPRARSRSSTSRATTAWRWASCRRCSSMYERAIAAFPDALLEDAHDLPEVAALLAPRRRSHLLRRADPLGRRPRGRRRCPARR